MSLREYADWTHVYVSYCTGDLHWGNASVSYLGGVTIEHRGAVNARAAVEWMQAALPSPEVVLVTGAFGQIGRDFMPILRQIFGPRHVIASDIAKPRKSEINFENLQMIEHSSKFLDGAEDRILKTRSLSARPKRD